MGGVRRKRERENYIFGWTDDADDMVDKLTCAGKGKRVLDFWLYR